jgi:hypothetical protein
MILFLYNTTTIYYPSELPIEMVLLQILLEDLWLCFSTRAVIIGVETILKKVAILALSSQTN